MKSKTHDGSNSSALGWSSALALQSCRPGEEGASAPAVFFSKLRHAFHLLRLTLREIFDERAYDRYLARTNAPRGRASYRAFTTERISLTARKPRCC
jgi:hypothetical protein